MSSVSAQSLWAANALWAGPLIVARLRAEVPALREVQMLDELEPGANGGAARPKQTPAAVVLLDRMRARADANHSKAVAVQDWLVALAVRSARTDADRNSALIGALIPPVVKALQGWQPGGQPWALAWQPGMQPNYGRDLSYYPLVFSLQVVTA